MSTPQFHALYCRLSRARNGQVESVERQERWGRTYADKAIADGRWPDLPIRVYADNDKSAWADDVERPDYNKLREAIRAGSVARIWAVEQTRLEANRRRWVDLAVELTDAGIEVIDTNRDGTVRLDEIADMKNVMAWHERNRLSRRVNDTLDDIAQQGRPSGSTSNGYRHVRDGTRSRLEVVPEMVPEIHLAAERALSGWPVAAIRRDLEERKVPTRRGGRWRDSTVITMLTSPTVAGKRVHRGEIIGDGDWEPILDEVTWRRLCAHFDRSDRARRRPPRKYVLSGGLAVCGVCDNSLNGNRKRKRKDRPAVHTYICHDRTGCSGVSVRADYLEAHVTSVFLAWLDSAEFRARMEAGDPGAAERVRLTGALADVDTRRRQTARRWARGELEEDEWDEARRVLGEEQARLNADLAAVPDPVVTVDPAAVIEAWPELTVDEQRHVLGLFLAKVVVRPATRKGPGFNADRVSIVDLDGNEVEVVWRQTAT